MIQKLVVVRVAAVPFLFVMKLQWRFINFPFFGVAQIKRKAHGKKMHLCCMLHAASCKCCIENSLR